MAALKERIRLAGTVCDGDFVHGLTCSITHHSSIMKPCLHFAHTECRDYLHSIVGWGMCEAVCLREEICPTRSLVAQMAVPVFCDTVLSVFVLHFSLRICLNWSRSQTEAETSPRVCKPFQTLLALKPPFLHLSRIGSDRNLCGLRVDQRE